MPLLPPLPRSLPAPAWLRLSMVVLVLTYAVGIGGMITPFTQPLFRWLTPAHLLLTFGLLLLQHPRWTWHTWVIGTLVGVLSFGVEAAGVATGIIFGQYDYGEPFGYQVLRTPLLIGVNWVLLTYCCTDLARRALHRLGNRHLAIPILAGLMMTAIDALLEPVAIKLDFWHWYHETVPLQNYLAWSVFGIIFCAFWTYGHSAYRNPLSGWIIALQAIFFAILGLAL